MSTPRSLDLPDQVRPVTIQSTGARSRRSRRSRPRACANAGQRCSSPASPAARKTSSRCCSRSRRPAAGWSPSTCAGSTRARAPRSAGGYAPGELAADIAAIIGALAGDGQGLHLVGHSLGGLIAREAALARAARIISLTLLGSGPGRITGQRADVLRGMLAMMAAAGRADGPGPDDDPVSDGHLARITGCGPRSQDLGRAPGAPGQGGRGPRAHDRVPARADDGQQPHRARGHGQVPAGLPGPHGRAREPRRGRRSWSSTARTTTRGARPPRSAWPGGSARTGSAYRAPATPPRSRPPRPRPARSRRSGETAEDSERRRGVGAAAR